MFGDWVKKVEGLRKNNNKNSKLIDTDNSMVISRRKSRVEGGRRCK